MTPEISKVATNALKYFSPVLHSHAISIFTPFTNPVPLSACQVNPDLRRFLIAYEPMVENSGLFPHQAEFLNEYAKNPDKDFIITTATGSGKSLCFWAWVFDRLTKNPTATAILCFPTQALMWGQAERLARISNQKSLTKPDGETAYAGGVIHGKRVIGWTIWHGKGSGRTFDPVMAEHEKSDIFNSARIRIATLDKVHWSLFQSRGNKEFARRLTCFVIDEAHSYDGVFGANVHYFMKRLFMASEILGQSRPSLLLASATLNSACKFASTLLSLERETDILPIADSTRQKIQLVSAGEATKQLQTPPPEGLFRMIFLLDGENEKAKLISFMGNPWKVGTEINAIYFSQSKFHSKRIKLELEHPGGKRDYVIYDADLPPKQRREMERMLNDPNVHGTTVLATSALELGVDIEGLDACFIDQLPPGRADLLQRIGRVGRREGRPGLVFLRLSAAPSDQHILDDPCSAFRLDKSRALPIPLHLDILRWRHALAAFHEWEGDLKYHSVEWRVFNEALERHFGFSKAPSYLDLKRQFEECYGTLVDMADKSWVHQGFRASASRGKIPLMEGKREVARIEDIAIFRDGDFSLPLFRKKLRSP